MGEGKIKFKCENGNWLKLSNSIYKSTCNINLCKSNQTVTWFSNEGNHICSDKILVTDGKIALVKYHKNDKRLFHSKSDALENSKIFEGRANFKCKNSKWIIDDNYENTCNKKQDFSCTVKHTIKVGSKYIKQYQCGVK